MSTAASTARNEAALAAGNDGATLLALDDGVLKGQADAIRQVQQALDQARSAAQSYTLSLEENVALAVASERSMRVLADATSNAAQLGQAGGNAFDGFTSDLVGWVSQARATGNRAGRLSGQIADLRGEAEDYAGHYDARLTADTSPARRAVREGVQVMNDYLDGLDNTVVKIGAQFDFGQSGGGGGSVNVSYGLADGGPVVGPGGPTDDRVPLWGSNGEYMIRAAAVDKYGTDFLDMVNAGRYRDGGLIEPRRKTTYRPSDAFASALASGDMLGDLFDATGDILGRGASDWASSLMSSAGSGGGGVERWRGVAMRALAYTGSPMSWLPSLMRRMNQESGGNPRAFNDWDINAINGVPSQGLMQTIPPTFYAYAGELAGRGIMDPFANIVAAIRYTIDRYGSGPAGWDRPGGYDSGGILGPGQSGVNFTRKPERVLSPRQTESFDRLVRILDTRAGAAVPVAASAGKPQALVITSGKLNIVSDRKGGLVAMMRDVVAQEMSDERAFRGR